VLLLDALEYSFSFAHRYHKAFYRGLLSLEKNLSRKLPNKRIVLSLFMNIWGLIDVCFRIISLIQKLPKWKKHLAFRSFIESTTNIEEMRHYVQHLGEKIEALPDEATPLWGVISWVSKLSPEVCYTIVSGTNLPGTRAYSCAYDTFNHEFAQNCIFGINDSLIEVNKLFCEIEKTQKYFLDYSTEFGHQYSKNTVPIFKSTFSEFETKR